MKAVEEYVMGSYDEFFDSQKMIQPYLVDSSGKRGYSSTFYHFHVADTYIKIIYYHNKQEMPAYSSYVTWDYITWKP